MNDSHPNQAVYCASGSLALILLVSKIAGALPSFFSTCFFFALSAYPPLLPSLAFSSSSDSFIKSMRIFSALETLSDKGGISSGFSGPIEDDPNATTSKFFAIKVGYRTIHGIS